MKYVIQKYKNRIKNKHINPVMVKIFPTWKCNLDCGYCSRHFVGENYHHENEKQLTPHEWLEVIKKFPIPVDVVYITGGGEPALYNGISELVSLLCDNGYCVKLFTNSMLYMDFPKNAPLIISTTKHQKCNDKSFYRNVEKYRKDGFKVEQYQFDESLESDFIVKGNSKAIILHDTEGMYKCINNPVFNFAPDGTLFTKQGEMFIHYRENGILKK